LTKCSSERYLKRLVGRRGIEDALKRLNELSYEEAQMVIAENMRSMHYRAN
jgi:hypothetical protein